MQIADLPNSWRALLVVGKLLGIAPFGISDGGILTRSWFGVAISLTVFIVPTVRLLLLWPRVLSSHLTTTWDVVSAFMESLGHAVTLVAVTLNSTTNVQRFRTILHYFNHVDGMWSWGGFVNSDYLQLITYAVYLTLMYGYGSWLAVQNTYLGVLYYVYLFGGYVRVFNILLLVNFLIYTKRRFHLVNACLRSMPTRSLDSVVSSVSTSQGCQSVSKRTVGDRLELRTLRDAHQSLCELVIITVSTFEHFLILYLPCIFADVMWLIYFPIRNDFMFDDRFAALFTATLKLLLNCALGLGKDNSSKPSKITRILL